MKLKSLLAIVSCSAIALIISVPSVAETIKDSNVKSTPTKIGNKQSIGEMFYRHSTKPLDFGSDNSTQRNESIETNGNENTIGDENIQINGNENTIGDENVNGILVCQSGATCNNNYPEVNKNPFNLQSAE